jgi:hypothetical protein
MNQKLGIRLHHWSALLLLCALGSYSTPSLANAVCPPGAPVTCLAGQGDWANTLTARSFDGGATVGGYFDSSLNITWLADADKGPVDSGTMTWSAATGWAHSLVVGGIGNGANGPQDYWRLPTMTDTGGSGCDFSYSGGTDCGYNVQTGTSEMAHMFYVTLGDKAYCPPGDATCAGGPQAGWGLTNTGPFANLQSYFYWTNLAYAPSPGSDAWLFASSHGSQDPTNQGGGFYAWAVHAGDVGVAPVPLPAGVWLFGSGLIGLTALSRRRRHLGDLAI